MLVHAILSDSERYVRLIPPPLEAFLRGSLLVAKAQTWPERRTMDQRAFDWAVSPAALAIMLTVAKDVTASWHSLALQREAIDPVAELQRITSRMLIEALLRKNASEAERAHLVHQVGAAEALVDRWSARWLVPRHWSAWLERRRIRAIKRQLDDLLAPLLRDTALAQAATDNFAAQLAQPAPDSSHVLSDEEVRDVIGNVAAGERAIAVAAAWVLYFLALDADLQQAARAEIRGLMQNEAMTLSQLQAMPLLDRIAQETLRLRPPTWRIYRGCVQETVLGGHCVPKGAAILISPYLVHRHPDYWSHPEQFDPARFDTGQRMAPATFLPFGWGPRSCIGAQLATLQVKLIVASAISTYVLAVQQPEAVRMDPKFYLDPLNLRLTLSPLEQH